MRGRKPRDFSLAIHDAPILQQIARSRTLSWLQVQWARVALAMASGERVQTVAFQMQCDASTVWRICRHYEQAGLEGLLSDTLRSGHPVEISPAVRPDCATGVSGAARSGIAYHPWAQPGSGLLNGCSGHCAADQCLYRAAHSARGGFAAASHAVLENGAPGRAV